MDWIKMTEIIGGKRYRTETSTLVASDCYWDGHNFERKGRNRFLFLTPNGRYFLQHLTQWQGELDRLESLDLEEALIVYEQLPEKCLEFERAFPGQPIEEA